MTKLESYPNYQDFYEYHGSTMIERIRKAAGKTIKRDWILFDSVEEAQEFFNTCCLNFGGDYAQSTC